MFTTYHSETASAIEQYERVLDNDLQFLTELH